MIATLQAAFALALGGLVAAASPLSAQQAGSGHGSHHPEGTDAGHSHEMSELHGGHAVMTPEHHFEVLFTPEEARVYLYDAKQKPMPSPEGLKGSIALQGKEGKKTELELEYVAPDEEQGRLQGYYAAPHDFSKAADGSVKSLVTMKGLAENPVQFTTPVTVSEPVAYACPMSCVPPVSDPMNCPKCGMEMKPTGGAHHMGEGGHEGHEDMNGDAGHGGH